MCRTVRTRHHLEHGLRRMDARKGIAATSVDSKHTTELRIQYVNDRIQLLNRNIHISYYLFIYAGYGRGKKRLLSLGNKIRDKNERKV